ncbi:hypothetical protein GCM10009841_34080 [Microlunatus panaciterrae]|uniref:SurA N-terminal domain-containing protein n=1 Tax=Microlunatus panaciterrae TaxID=400768 RepID=A0ABS2RHQ8_9ACTN|nr:hypothetical protein [Microlunatus panaciterrae]MBM7798067.1 hypothetical protein [Microlunatus panaciterrae]
MAFLPKAALRHRHVRTAGAALASLAMVAVAGCASGSPHVVAYVDGVQISQSQLHEAVSGVAQAFGTERQIKEQAIVDAMVRGEVAAQLASEKKITITDAERDALFSGDADGAKLLAVPAARQVAYDLADEQIVAKQLGVEAYLAGLKKAKVKLNPRYGVWSADAAAQGSTAVQDQSSSLSKSGSSEQR